MQLEYWLGALIASMLTFYLVYALLVPERF
jgi:K+-transporting ATPase KdpF subunit